MSGMQLTDTKLQRLISVTLRSGVMTASLIGLIGGVLFLTVHGGQPVSFHTFEGAGTPYASPAQNVRQAVGVHVAGDRNRGLAITQLGIMLLLLTPVIHVAFSIIGFAMERDRVYVGITSIVLVTLKGS